MQLQITNHVAVVQGGSKGIGLGIAHSLAREGCDLVLTARNGDHLENQAKIIAEQTGRKVLPFVLDSSDLSKTKDLISFVEKEFGRLDIIVANSGGPPAGTLKPLTVDQWQEAATLLIASPALLVKSALPLLSKSPAPRFFVVTSSSTVTPINGLTLSNTFRPGLVGLIKTLTEELAPEGVCCHSIAPGRFDTERLGHVIDLHAEKQGKTPDEIKSAMLATIPAGRLGEPVEIGDLVAFLSSPLASYLRGGNWLVDGGLLRVV
jgi:3-oxoacyl-[acyl-carrier protein] reductase